MARAPTDQHGTVGRRQQEGKRAPVLGRCALQHARERRPDRPLGRLNEVEQRARPHDPLLRADVEVTQTSNPRVENGFCEQAGVQRRQDADPSCRPAVDGFAAGDDQELIVRHPLARSSRADSGEATTVAPVRTAIASAP